MVSSKALTIDRVNKVSLKAFASEEIDMVRMQMDGGGEIHNYCPAIKLELHAMTLKLVV
jgi:hypothetical protein